MSGEHSLPRHPQPDQNTSTEKDKQLEVFKNCCLCSAFANVGTKKIAVSLAINCCTCKMFERLAVVS